VAALRAGTDLLLCGPDPDAQDRVERALHHALERELLDPRELRASASRLDALRSWLDGFAAATPPIDAVGSAEHRALAAELAVRSITLVRDDEGRLPVRLSAGARVLVIEPRPRDLTPADTTSSLPPGGVAAAIRARHPAAEGHLIEPDVAPGEIAAFCELAAGADLVILGTVDALGQPSIAELAGALVATDTPVIAVALRGPWDAVAYPEVGTVLATYGIQPPSLAALAGALWGDAPITGRLPVRLPDAVR